MFNVGSGEMLLIFLVALIILGPDRLPDAARKVGTVVGDLRKMSSGFKQEMKQAMDIDSLRQEVNGLKQGLSPNPGPNLPPLVTPEQTVAEGQSAGGKERGSESGSAPSGATSVAGAASDLKSVPNNSADARTPDTRTPDVAASDDGSAASGEQGAA